MALLSFRQGIVNHGKSPGQSFFLQQNGTYVNLIVTPEQTILSFADGIKDYMYTEATTTVQAWGPFSPSVPAWLYWDIDTVTGIRTFGSTLLEPIYLDSEPASPATGQMWFDNSQGGPTSNTMHEYNGISWVRVIRLVAAKYVNNKFLSPINGVSIETNFIGTQIGTTGNISVSVGSLVYGSSGKPIIDGENKFFTTEDVFTTGVPTGASLKVNNTIITALAQEAVGAYNVVKFTSYDGVNLATPFAVINAVYGIVETGATVNEVLNVVTNGRIFNEAWDFTDTVNNPDMSGSVNDPLYLTATGELTTNISISIPSQVPLGVIVGKQAIIFNPGIYGTGSTGSGSGTTVHGALTGLSADDHPQYLTNARGDARYYTTVASDARFLNLAGGTLTGVLTLNADPQNPLEAATMQYVDNASGVSYCLQDTDGDTLIAVGYDVAGVACIDSGSNNVIIRSGNAVLNSTAGGTVDIFSGVGNGANAGAVNIKTANGGSYAGGIISITAGDSVYAQAGAININAGKGTGINGVGGNITIASGDGAGGYSGTAGDINIVGSTVVVGYGGGSYYKAGSVNITTASGALAPGDINITLGGGLDAAGYSSVRQSNINIRRDTTTAYQNDSYAPEVRFYDGGDSRYVSLKAPRNASISKNVEYDLPTNINAANGATTISPGQVLSVGNVTESATEIKAGMYWVDVPYDLVAQGFGILLDADVLVRLPTIRAYTLLAKNPSTSFTAPTTASTVIDVVHYSASNAATIWGTVTITTGGVVSFVGFTADLNVLLGERMEVVCTTSGGVADVAIGLAGKI